MELLNEVETFLDNHFESLDNRRFLVAVSGGPDSMALVDLLDRLKDSRGVEIGVAHVNYRMHRHADRAESTVRQWCEEAEVPYIGLSLLDPTNIEKNREGVEGMFRRVRYEFFAERAREGNYDGVCLAHHADDRVETVLLNLGRGTGLHGMAGISPVTEFHGTQLIRPLLSHRKSRLEQYVDERDLDVVGDPTNEETAFTRNRIRHEVLPAWEDVQSNPSDSINRVSRQAERENDFWDQYVRREISCRTWPAEIQVNRESFREAHRAVQDRFLHWLPRQLTGHVTGWDRTNFRTLRELFSGRSGRRIDLPGPLRAVVEFDRVAVYRVGDLDEHDFPFTPLGGDRWSRQMGIGSVVVSDWNTDSDLDHGSRVDLSQQTLTRVRRWRPGDQIYCAGEWLSLKSVFQENRVPKRARHRWPVVEGMGELLVLPGLAVSDCVASESGSDLVGFQPNHPAFLPTEKLDTNDTE